ncbi:PLP-dependent aminotransferase family protein [Actinomadura sp. WMMA1423]|uniref:aminotransferase-like domain-containing protein n=1 Tax=Actinomadura sp. WMMA1423 TaxID=2591108 RepID=UPI0011470402|nr:PLP-dependent aminotransferase family protein [Actinomadura sp. WMMA1423]
MRTSDSQLAAALGGWRRPGVALARALADAVGDAALDGRLRVGSPLPAERRTATALGVSRGTVTAALDLLRAEGWIDTRRGSASTLRLPPEAAARIAPSSAVGEDGAIDLTSAVPAAPHTAYQQALLRATERSGPVLAESGETGPGLPELRSLIADRCTAEGLATRPEQILITSGARAALALLTAHLRPRAAAVEIPTYPAALAGFRAAGTRLAGCRVTTDGWDLDQLDDAFRAAAGGLAYLVPDFQNPTGALMPVAVRRTVARLAGRHGVTVVADETMRDLDLRAAPSPLERIPRAVLVGSAAKTVWAGLRVGWIRGTAALIGELARHPLCEPLSAAPTQQMVAAELLRDPAPVLDHRRAVLRQQRDHLSGLLGGDDRWRFTVPPGGLALWLRLTAVRSDVVTAEAREYGLELSPGPAFAADATCSRHLRLPYTSPITTLDRVAAVMDGACGGKGPQAPRPGARP